MREQNKEFFITYKGPRLDNISKTREEFEVAIDDVNNMKKILTSLGFYPVATIVKKRKIYRFEELSIVLDNVRNLGNFIEIEISSKDTNYEKNVESILKFMEKLGIRKEDFIRKSYLEMILNK